MTEPPVTDAALHRASERQPLSTIHLIVGTKAQFIKMAPVALFLERQGYPYRILDLGQHGSITPGILRDFGLGADVSHVLRSGRTVSTYGQALRWLTSAFLTLVASKKTLRGRFLQQPAEYALIHGDTLSTLLGLYLGKRLGLRVGLVEAGLSSGRLLDPFPEEWIRRHVEKRADFLFAPDPTSGQRLGSLGLKGKILNTGYNTGRDALLLIARIGGLDNAAAALSGSVLTLHRAETLGRPRRLASIVNHVMELAPHIAPVRFFLHEPTRNALERADLLGPLKASPHFTLSPLASYPEFVRAMTISRYILTDGGSIQEEASYLHKPCLVLRRSTERSHGIGVSAMLASMDRDLDLAFLTGQGGPESGSLCAHPTLDASRVMVEFLKLHSNEGGAG